jgi:indole-3-glycerol phosphate synthase
MDWNALRSAKDAELARLTELPLSEVRPSIRSFAQYVTTHKQELACIAALKRTDPRTGRSWSQTDLVALARICDEAEVGAVGVYTEPSLFGTSLDDLRVVSEAVSAPVVRLDLVIHPRQIHHARLCGADALVLWAGGLEAETLSRLINVAGASHMTPVVAVQTPAEVDAALSVGAFVLGISSPSGRIELKQVEQLTALIPPHKTVIVLDELAAADECAALRGTVDAVLVGNLLLDAPDAGALLASLAEH